MWQRAIKQKKYKAQRQSNAATSFNRIIIIVVMGGLSRRVKQSWNPAIYDENTPDLMTELQHDLNPAKHPHRAPFFAWKCTADEKYWQEFSENTLQNHRCTFQSVEMSTPLCVEIQKNSRCRVKMK